MSILHRYLAREIFISAAFIFAALLSLFAFFDVIHELGDLGKGQYRLLQALAVVALNLPGHIYQLFPIAALIGTLFALARLSAHSEFTIMRVSGLSTASLARALLQIGMVFVVLTLIFGELITPKAEQMAEQLRLNATRSVMAKEFRSGMWIKDRQSFINVKEILPDTTLLGVRIFEFDTLHRLQKISYAERGVEENSGNWKLSKVTETRFDQFRAEVVRYDELRWQSVLTPDMLSVLLVVPEQMSAWNLFQYVEHLRENKQKTTRYEIALWSKLAYPFATLAMMIFALPFAFMQTRSGGVSSRIFGGIMIGLAFHLLNRVFAHLGLLYDWPPLFSATFPAIAFLTAAFGMIWWLERR